MKDIFESNITASHIAEELKYCNSDIDFGSLKENMEKLDFDTFGITTQSDIKGYIEYSDVNDNKWKENIKTFDSSDLITDSTPLLNILPILKKKERIFVLYGNQVRGIITRSDLQKITVRMFLFGLISLLELNITKIIRDEYPDDLWKDLINEKRLIEAEKLLDAQKLKSENISLLDCLQLTDKTMIFRKSENIIERIGCSKSKLKSIFGYSTNLRNTIAHSKNLIDLHSSDIIDLAIDIDYLLEKMANMNRGNSIGKNK